MGELMCNHVAQPVGRSAQFVVVIERGRPDLYGVVIKECRTIGIIVVVF